jgi:hypothetical protein
MRPEVGTNQGRGKAVALGFNFGNDDVPPAASFEQGVEGGKEGRCTERLEANRERRRGEGGRRWWPGPFMRSGAGIGAVWAWP